MGKRITPNRHKRPKDDPKVRTVRSTLRELVRAERMKQRDLAKVWGVTEGHVHQLFWKRSPLPPLYIEQACKFFRLDDFDTAELMLLGAREAGWKINVQRLLDAA